MNTELFIIDSPKGHEKEIARVAQILKDGGLAVIPTETVYGLGGLATSRRQLH